jgi:hypothetical protein
MERLRKSDDLERGANLYGWRDILMEEVGLSRDEYEILTDSMTDSNAIPFWRMYGFPNGTIDADVITGLSNAKQFARRVGITYEDLVSILRSCFINPNSDLILKLERLGVSFATLKALKGGTITDSDFDNLLAALAVPPDPAEYGGDIKGWVKNDDNYARIMSMITLAVPANPWTASKAYVLGDCILPTISPGTALYHECTTAGTSAATEPAWPTTAGTIVTDGSVQWTCRDPSSCHSFDNMAFRYSDPAKLTQNIGAAEYVRLLRFIRLWKKLGWTIAQTDAAMCAFYRDDLIPPDASDLSDVAKLDSGFLTLLPRLGIVKCAMRALNLRANKDLLSLLACFAPIGTHDGVAWMRNSEGRLQQQIVPSLYRQMLLNPALLKQDSVFNDNGYGEFLQYVDVPYTHPQPTLEQPIVNAAQGTINYDDSTKRLSYAGILDATMRDALKAVPGVSPDFRQAVDGLYRVQRLATHTEALRSAFNLTGEEYDRIVAALGYDADTALTIPSISAIFRRGWLARKLKLSVRELLLLIQLTGLDPFASPKPTNPAILRLIELVQMMRNHSLKSAVALYLIWNQDLSGKSRPDAVQIATFARTLRLGLAAVETEFAVADDPDGTVAQAQLAKVYGADAAAFFLGLLNDALSVEIEFSDPDGTLAPGAVRQAIENAAGKTGAGVPKITYDDFRKRLAYSSVLTTATRDQIKLAAGVGAAAFKTAMDNLYDKNQAVINPFFARYPELQSPYDAYVADSTHSAVEKRSILLKAILPDLIKRRKRQQALQAVSAAANMDLAVTETFLDSPAAPLPLHAAGHVDQLLLNDFLALETAGLSVQFFASDTATGLVITAPDIAPTIDYAPLAGGVGNPLPANPTPGAAISGIWNGYIEAPDSGFFRLRVETDVGATVTLLFHDKPIALAQNGPLWDNTEPIELRAGTLYPVRLTVGRVSNVVRLQWEWQPKGQGRAIVPARYLYPAALFETFKEAYVCLLKVASLATALRLTANELAFFATHSDYQINADGWLNALTVSGDPAPAIAAALLKPFEALLHFARIKAEISPGDESLLTLLKDPTTATQNTESLLFNITRWNQTSLNDVLAQFGGNIAGFEQFDLFRRVCDAFALIQKMGISAKALIEATTNEPTTDTVRGLQAALRARYDPVSWCDVVRPINDEMRSVQRDALVAYILHQMRSHPKSQHIDTPDKLFEYFLMDVQMDACMQTSRIRHALSSVQLFIERCMMTLESRVSPAFFDDDKRKQWEWMKRYRVWEVNRKVFLWPENWLEPELRDDQSPFFKETISELLQGDITEDRAAVALLNYLSKLEEVAKLEPCGIYYIAGDQASRTNEVTHVVARTAGAHRKYYYRRYEFGYWTPWTQIKLDIEDNPVIPVVWNDRLLLFWLRILKKGPDTAAKPRAGKKLAELDTIDLPDDPQLTVQVVLCWSEYYNGKWQPTKTSDVNNPVSLGMFSPFAGQSSLRLRSDEPQEGQLRITIYGDVNPQAFLLYNTHSLPLPCPPAAVPPAFGKTRGFETAGPTFTIGYDEKIPDVPDHPLSRDLLTEQIPAATVQPNHYVSDVWDAPFFFEDRQNVFYVRTGEQPVWIPNFGGFGVSVNPGVMEAPRIPPLVVQPGPPIRPKFWGDGRPIGPDLGVIDPVPMRRLVTEDAYIRQGIGTTAVITYDGKQIGPSGAIMNTQGEV